MTRFSTALLLATVLAASLPLAAHADPCTGDKLESKSVSAGADEIGRLELYYDPVNAQHCATLQHAGPTEKKPAYTQVSVAVCQDRQCRAVLPSLAFDGDSQYVDEAGPVRLAAHGQCVVANGVIVYQGETHVVHGTPHCG